MHHFRDTHTDRYRYLDKVLIYIYMVHRPSSAFCRSSAINENARKYLVPMFLSSGCKISLGTGQVRDVFTRVRVPTLHVASCLVEHSVDELHCCALSTGSAKGEQLSKALLLRLSSLRSSAT